VSKPPLRGGFFFRERYAAREQTQNRESSSAPGARRSSEACIRRYINNDQLETIVGLAVYQIEMALSLNKSQRYSMLFVACFLACLNPIRGHAEVASVYGGSDGHCGTSTANGERVDCGALTAAHRTLRFGTHVKVCYHKCVVVRINDRGPFVRGRDIDLTPAAARAIELTDLGRVTISPEQ
jgi:rare lipoprotein A